MKRPLDWRTRLVRWALAQPGRPFVWGETDCATLARQAVVLCYGEDPWPDTPQWHTAREAKRAHAASGGMVAALECLGARHVPLNFARTGDIVAFPEPKEKIGGMALGVWVDDRCLLSSDEGVFMARRTDLPADAMVLTLEPAHG